MFQSGMKIAKSSQVGTAGTIIMNRGHRLDWEHLPKTMTTIVAEVAADQDQVLLVLQNGNES